jgi:predicted nucleotide-binding protein
MQRPRILFQGSQSTEGSRTHSPEELEAAARIASALGSSVIAFGFDLVLTSAVSLDQLVGKAAAEACQELDVEPRDRIRTIAYGSDREGGFGMVLPSVDRVYQDARTGIVEQCDAVVALAGRRGTSDAVQKARLARKPVFPIAVAGGAAAAEWEKLKVSGYKYSEPGDIDFLSDRSAEPEQLVKKIMSLCSTLLARDKGVRFSRRIFVVHGRDASLKSQLARFLERLEFEPVILHEQPDSGQMILTKLQNQLQDVGYGFVLHTPDDVGALALKSDELQARARQNVVFEFGLLIGHLGQERVCAIIDGEIEQPSDLHGLVYKQVPTGGDLTSIELDLVKELKSAGYEVDANKL